MPAGRELQGLYGTGKVWGASASSRCENVIFNICTGRRPMLPDSDFTRTDYITKDSTAKPPTRTTRSPQEPVAIGDWLRAERTSRTREQRSARCLSRACPLLPRTDRIRGDARMVIGAPFDEAGRGMREPK